MAETMLPVAPQLVSRFTEAAPFLLTAKELMDPHRGQLSQDISTLITGIQTLENANNVTEALRSGEWATAGASMFFTAFWGVVASYNLERSLERVGATRPREVAAAEKMRGYGMVAMLAFTQHLINRRLGK